jgi:hypothetical protein
MKHILLGLVIIFGFIPATAMAQTSSSPNYQVDQTFFGSGGETGLESDNFLARAALGELGIGELNSDNFRAFAGFTTTDEPFIEFVVTGNNIDLGYLTTDEVTTAQGQFYVRAWQAGGYAVTSEAEPPTNVSNGYQFESPEEPTSSQPGTEQFAMNLVANSSPNVGEDLIQQPDGSFSFGQVASDYAQQNNFLHNKGDIIAFSEESTSVTLYTISYIFNISNATPSGQYEFRQILVATGQY